MDSYLNTENFERSKDGVEYHPLIPFLPEHTVTYTDMRLYIRLGTLSRLKLFAEHCHKDPQGADLRSGITSPDLLKNIVVR